MGPTVQFKQYGTIEYFLAAKIKTEKRLKLSKAAVMNKITKKHRACLSIRILGSILPDVISHRSVPVTFENTKSFVFTLRKGKLHLKGILPRTYAASGEIVNVNVQVNNDTNKTVKSIVSQIVRNYRISVRDGDKHEARNFYEILQQGETRVNVKRKNSLENIKVSYEFPPNIVPSFHGTIFSITYDIVLIAIIEAGHTCKLATCFKDFLVIHQPFPAVPSRLSRPNSNTQNSLSNSAPLPSSEHPSAATDSSGQFYPINYKNSMPSVQPPPHHVTQQPHMTQEPQILLSQTDYWKNSVEQVPVNAPIQLSQSPSQKIIEHTLPSFGYNAPASTVPLKPSQSGHFYNLPGTEYKEETENPGKSGLPSYFNESFFLPPGGENLEVKKETAQDFSTQDNYEGPMVQRLIEVAQPDGSVIQVMGWVPANFYQ